MWLVAALLDSAEGGLLTQDILTTSNNLKVKDAQKMGSHGSCSCCTRSDLGRGCFCLHNTAAAAPAPSHCKTRS